MREIKRGDVYYADLSPVLGSEQGGLPKTKNQMEGDGQS